MHRGAIASILALSAGGTVSAGMLDLAEDFTNIPSGTYGGGIQGEDGIGMLGLPLWGVGAGALSVLPVSPGITGLEGNALIGTTTTAFLVSFTVPVIEIGFNFALLTSTDTPAMNLLTVVTFRPGDLSIDNIITSAFDTGESLDGTSNYFGTCELASMEPIGHVLVVMGAEFPNGETQIPADNLWVADSFRARAVPAPAAGLALLAGLAACPMRARRRF